MAPTLDRQFYPTRSARPRRRAWLVALLAAAAATGCGMPATRDGGATAPDAAPDARAHDANGVPDGESPPPSDAPADDASVIEGGALDAPLAMDAVSPPPSDAPTPPLDAPTPPLDVPTPRDALPPPPDAGPVVYAAGNPCRSDGSTIYSATGVGGSAECVVTFAGAARSYRLHVPPSYRAGTGALVVVLHGDGGSGMSVESETQWSARADAVGFAVAYPNGVAPPGRSTATWNFYFKDLPADDAGFIRQVVTGLRSTLRPDPRRIFATGMSAGAFMTHRLGVELSDVFAAIAPVSGMIYARTPGDTRVPSAPANPVSVLMMLGDADTSVLYCGRSTATAMVTSSDQVFDFWSGAIGCTGSTPAGTLCTAAGVPSTLTMRAGTGCPAGRDVVLYRLMRGVHAYYTTPMNNPTGTPYNPAFNAAVGITTTEIIWNFFVSHAR